MLRFGLWKKCRSGADVAAGLWWLKDLEQAKAELKQARPQMVLSPSTAQAVEAAANRLKQG